MLVPRQHAHLPHALLHRPEPRVHVGDLLRRVLPPGPVQPPRGWRAVQAVAAEPAAQQHGAGVQRVPAVDQGQRDVNAGYQSKLAASWDARYSRNEDSNCVSMRGGGQEGRRRGGKEGRRRGE